MPRQRPSSAVGAAAQPQRGFPRLPARVTESYGSEFQPLRFEPPPVGGFSGAGIWKAETPAGVWCLRGWPPASLPPERILGLHRLLVHIAGQGVKQVPVPVRARDGGTLVEIEGRFWQIEPWMPGRADFRSRPSEKRMRNAMDVLAAWHRAAALFRPRAEHAAWFSSKTDAASPAVLDRLARLRHWSAHRRNRLAARLARSLQRDFAESGLQVLHALERWGEAIAGELTVAADWRVPLQPCLRDVWHDHVLFTSEEVTGLIDPSASRSENVAADLARLIGSLAGDDVELWSAALEEYQRHRRLTAAERALVDVLDRSGVLLSGLTWLERFEAAGGEFVADERLVNRMRWIAGRLTHGRNCR